MTDKESCLTVAISELMRESGVAFGTSGARGLVTKMTDQVCSAYTAAFLAHLEQSSQVRERAVAIGADLRASSDRIAAACADAARNMGYRVIHCGKVSSPALACYGLEHGIATIMVTGSHIPEDRNGLKFNLPTGEITKDDEQGMRAQRVVIDRSRFDATGALCVAYDAGAADAEARLSYIRRYEAFFGNDFLAGMRIGVYQHSAVLRDDLMEIVGRLGGEALALGRSETFIPVDTEAIRSEDRELAARWAQEHDLDAILSADGDSDRPLVSDERGGWLRGDIAGVLCARYLRASSVSTPVSCNSALELSGYFPSVKRTMIGSPFVIAAMNQELQAGREGVVGYEANGGFLIGSPLVREGRTLPALPTRDAVIVMLSILGMAKEQRCPISALLRQLPERYTYSERIKDFPTELSRRLLAELDTGSEKIAALLGDLCGELATIDRTDGLRLQFTNGEIVHFRPSGNAPELRCYTEAASEERAQTLNLAALQRVMQFGSAISKN